MLQALPSSRPAIGICGSYGGLNIGVDGLLVAGRCMSGTHEAHSSYRVTPIAMATGHAAGVCAALAARSGRPARRVPHREVQQELLRQGASLRPEIRQALEGRRDEAPAARS
ncbi:MAG: hypothetical protein QOJ57_1279 [Thermoleophilaceae bacterium]|nr:hypothetical protein [Thermoleophilaceae bacterium]